MIVARRALLAQGVLEVDLPVLVLDRIASRGLPAPPDRLILQAGTH